MSNDNSELEYSVVLHVYDLTRGMAKQFAPMFGLQLEGIWHTGVVVYGFEYFYGGGITYGPPGQTIAGEPNQVLNLGVTSIPQEVFHEYLHEISNHFTSAQYSLISHNCNHFTNEVSQFLVGTPIPHSIVNLPEIVLNTPIGKMIGPMLANFENSMKEARGRNLDPYATEWDGILLPPIIPRSGRAKLHSTNSKSESTEKKSGSVAVTDLNFDRPFLSKGGDITKLFKLLQKTLSSEQYNEILPELSNLSSFFEDLSKPPSPSIFLFFERFISQYSNQYSVILLSILRLFVSHSSAAALFTSKISFIHSLIDSIILPSNEKLSLIVFPIMANLFSHIPFRTILSSDLRIYSAVIHGLSSENILILHCSTDLAFNLSLYIDSIENSPIEDSIIEMAVTLIELINNEKYFDECGLHCLMVLYCLIKHHPSLRELFTALDIIQKLKRIESPSISSEMRAVCNGLLGLLS